MKARKSELATALAQANRRWITSDTTLASKVANHWANRYQWSQKWSMGTGAVQAGDGLGSMPPTPAML
jgi:hypothetical protein